MPTIIGDRTGSSSRPYLELDWSINYQQVANNRSNVNLKLYLRVPNSNIGYSARYTGTLQGASYTSKSGYISTSGRYLLAERNVWVGHNSNGTKTQRFTADYNLNMTWSGTYYGKISLSGDGVMTTIPRGSTLNSYSFSNALQIGTSNTITYSVTKHASSYRNRVRLYDGAVLLQTWDNQNTNGTGNTVTVASSVVDAMLGRMSTVTSKTYTLRIDTRAGTNGGIIGSASTKTASVSVNSNVKPTIASKKAVPIGNSWAVGKGYYVQGQTGVQAEFSSNARGGAGVRSRSISVGNLSSGGAVTGSVFRHSQTRLNTTGNVTITYKITDTRGRSASDTLVINVKGYSLPQITEFSAQRSRTTNSTVTVSSVGSIHSLGGLNSGTLRITQKIGTGSTSTESTINLTSSSNTFDDSFNRTVSTASSAEYNLTVTDALGNTATSTSTTGTAFMEFSIRKGVGVGIGKVHERGSLDADGDIFIGGRLHVAPKMVAGDRARSNIGMFSNATNGHGYIEYFGSDGLRKSWVGIGSPEQNTFSINANEGNYDIELYTRGKVRARGVEIAATGGSVNGRWYRFYNGLQIVTGKKDLTFNHSDWQPISYPVDFSEVGGVSMRYAGFPDSGNTYAWRSGLSDIYAYVSGSNGSRFLHSGTSVNITGPVYYTVVGRWDVP